MKDRLSKMIQDSVGGCAKHWADIIADYLIANGVIVPPCKIGDKVYEIWDMFPQTIMESEVGCIVQKGTNDFSMELWLDAYGGVICSSSDIGKTAFLTRKEAEKALAERSEGEG